MRTLDEVIKAHEMCIERIRKGEDNCSAECPFVSCCCPERMVMILDALHYLKILKAKSEEPPLGEKPDYIPLGFHDLAEMLGEPVYVKSDGCKGRWEIVTAVRKTVGSEDVSFRGNDRWQRLSNDVYRTKEGAEDENAE